MIYVLLLENQKIYVGYSARPVGKRFLEHFNYSGSRWTSLHKPLEVLEVMDGDKIREDEVTLNMMERYGWWNVRGGRWCQVDMNSCPEALLTRKKAELPETIRRGNYKSRYCEKRIQILRAVEKRIGAQNTIKSSSKKVSSNACFRCGRTSHFASGCFATTNVNGQKLKKRIN